jgi:hypothetical protein
MKRSIVRQNTNDAGVKPFQYELSLQPVPTIEFLPSEIVRHKTASWRGIQAKTVQVISLEPFEYRFKQQGHLLIAIEQGVRHEGETFLEGLPKTTIRHYSNTLIFVPVGRTLFGVQTPRLLPRSICLYIDPQAVLVDPDLRFAEVELQPRLLFEDRAIWETVLKLKAQIGSDDPTDRMYADSLGGVLAHELLRLNGNIQSSRGSSPGGLATWQQRSGMNTITAAAGEYSAIISGGARASDVVAVTDPLGLAVVTGSVGAVGVAGLTLGGYGPLMVVSGLRSTISSPPRLCLLMDVLLSPIETAKRSYFGHCAVVAETSASSQA